eukprot:Hpha_TRINITY_DN4045_c0_g1::TRINITY_DN4045_c0_g1_i1::g.63831::m.63831
MADAFDRSLAAIFVCRFDVDHGNLLEWGHPTEGVDLEGVEWKALVSGWHEVERDFALFRWKGFFGIAAFNRFSHPSAPRGAWQRSVGVLCSHLYFAAQHVEVIAGLAAGVNARAEDYTPLLQYFGECSAVPPAPSLTPMRDEDLCEDPMPFNNHKDADAYLRHIALAWASCDQLVQYLGPDVFLLRRCLLSGLRVLFLAESREVGTLCCLCHAASALLTAPGEKRLRMPLRKYLVSAADIDDCSKLPFYVACTADRILGEKRGLFDVLVDGRRVITQREELRRGRSMDKEQLEIVRKQLAGGRSAVVHFEEMNMQLLHCAAKWRGRSVGAAALKSLALTPAAGRFIFSQMEAQVEVVSTGCCCEG